MNQQILSRLTRTSIKTADIASIVSTPANTQNYVISKYLNSKSSVQDRLIQRGLGLLGPGVIVSGNVFQQVENYNKIYEIDNNEAKAGKDP